MKPKITAFRIKHDVMAYFRFNRQCICASECLNNDVMVITKLGLVIEVEVKISKYDLWKGEAKKSKHKFYKQFDTSVMAQCSKSSMANRFYICIPTILEEEAIKWVEEINPKYGIIRYEPAFYNSIMIARHGKLLHNEKSEKMDKYLIWINYRKALKKSLAISTKTLNYCNRFHSYLALKYSFIFI